MREIIFLADGRDFHALDWYRTIKKICSHTNVYLATDIIQAEGREKLLDEYDNVIHLYRVDKYLFQKQSFAGNSWRNLIKLLLFPLQVICLKRIAKLYPNAVFHAHTMYYLFIAWLAGIEYIGSPQGDEILIRPYRSKLYYFFARRSLKKAKYLIVDSENLRKGINRIADRDADVIQYGIDVAEILKETSHISHRDGVVSIRAWYPLYRIAQIINERNFNNPDLPLTFFFPFSEEGYMQRLRVILKPNDKVLGRLPNKLDVYQLLSKSKLVISIPESDSSPRSVYESIFCGCVVAVTYNPWIDHLPLCMKKRIIVVDITLQNWLLQAINSSEIILQEKYEPSDAALEMFDQERSMSKVAKKYYV